MADRDHPQETPVRPPEQRERTGRDRRAHPRFSVEIPIEIDVGVYGVTAVGTTVNLSRCGVLANLDNSIEVGESCTVRFPGAGPRADSLVSATVVRTQQLGAVNLIALQFSEALPSSSAIR